MRSADEVVYITLELYEHGRTERALLVSGDGERESAVWLPLSQIEMEQVGSNKVHKISVPQWLATREGLV